MKILEISGKLNIGGAQAVAANIAKYADDRFSFVYIVFGDDVGEYEAQVAAKGNKIIHIPSPAGDLCGYFRTLMKIMREERVDVVHCHTMYNCGIVMLAAKLAGVRGRISHSHTIKDESRMNLKRRIYVFSMRMFIYIFGTDYLACGVDAGCVLYGEKWFRRHGTVIRNGIDLEKYRYDESTRARIRKQYGIENSFVIGHVGHYVHVKNQRYLIELMPKILEQRPNAKLIMFGGGSDRDELQRLADEKGLAEQAVLAGNADNIHEILSAFDVFAFPSLYEGTPLALIEAQANGLTCIISDTVPDDACLTDAVIKLPLDNEDMWVTSISRAQRENSDMYVQIIMERYGDINRSMAQICSVFDRYGGEEGKA